VRRVLASGRFILGPEVEAFEREFAAYVGVGSAVGVGSGTDAIALALRAVGVGPGDEVITVTNAGVPPVAAIRATGAVPRFVDVRPDTLLLDADALEGALDERTRCVLPVHLYGQPVDLDAVLAFARRHDLTVVEDCAQAHGAAYRGRHPGGFGRVGCFSFYPTKNLGAYGDAGACVTDDRALAERLRGLRTYGFDERRHTRFEGGNSRLDEVQAAILRAKLPHLDAWVRERRALAARYAAELEGTPYAIPGRTPGAEHAHHLFAIECSERDRATDVLKARGIGFGIHYAEPVHTMEGYRFLGLGPGALPVSERACRRILSLPLHPGLPEDAVARVARALRDAG
jgi:dTDP-4-amino-4,6-dideoxygalactose transaminase